MLQSATTSVVQPTLEGDLTPRRIRHVTGIQIRNLTPFPVRDAFTSALTQPAQQSHFNVSGVNDDLGAILPRKRSRKVSTNSTATRRSLKWEDGIPEQDKVVSSETRGRTTSASRITFSTNGRPSASPSNATQSFSSPRSTQSLRSCRARTSSMTSSYSNHPPSASLPLGSSSASISTPSFLPDNSQAALENIIGSRLVESFLVVAIPERAPSVTETLGSTSSSRSTTYVRSAPAQTSTFILASPVAKTSINCHPNAKHSPTPTSLNKGRFSPPDSAPRTKASFKPLAPKKQDSKTTKSAPRLNGTRPPSNSSPREDKSFSTVLLEPESVPEGIPNLPVYFSPIHRPSTNPFFPIDPRSGRDFPLWSDTSDRRLKIEVWGRTILPRREEGKARDDRQHLQNDNFVDVTVPDWKMLDEWDVDLNKLLPLPDDLDTNPSQLPSNTVVITLLPPGRSFYLPKKHLSRSPTPSTGYTSDPESEIRKAKQVSEEPRSTVDTMQSIDIIPLSRRRRHKGSSNTADFRETTKTVGWQELFKLVTLQSCILDNQSSVNEVVRKIDALLEEDETFPLRREISEREARVKELRMNHSTVIDQIAHLRHNLEDRAHMLQQRAELLASAGDGLVFTSEMDDDVESERTRLALLRERMSSARTSLLSTLSTIFPIELYSPPDLLFTILDVPLPIPLTSNDPAPPLTLPNHKEVTEEAVATALGYVAQVLQILAAYIGKSLIYPVTCIGSRSLIRDGISAMVGPRLFPLFSKGVDTYRFEYGVFLLNKDIELLMGERDLRALDMRHTLPNLKNLLLTLSHDVSTKSHVHVHPQRIPDSPISLASGMETPSRESSPVDDDVRTPKASHVLDPHAAVESTTPTRSGATTPTTVTDESRKGKSFLGFVPFTDFLRARYPSTSQCSDRTILKSATSTEEVHGKESDDPVDPEVDVDEEDRMTIHGVAAETHDNVPDAHTSVEQGTVVET